MQHSSDHVYGQWNAQSGFVLDMEKGVYVDSSTMDHQQFTRYYRTQNNLTRPDLNLRQAIQFSNVYGTTQKYLIIKKYLNNIHIGRLGRMTSFSYVSNHFREIFGHSEAILKLAQKPNCGGWLRSDVDREKIYEYGKKRIENHRKLGMLESDKEVSREQKVQQITQYLRERYGLASKHQPKASAVTVEDA